MHAKLTHPIAHPGGLVRLMMSFDEYSALHSTVCAAHLRGCDHHGLAEPLTRCLEDMLPEAPDQPAIDAEIARIAGEAKAQVPPVITGPGGSFLKYWPPEPVGV